MTFISLLSIEVSNNLITNDMLHFHDNTYDFDPIDVIY
jgi:hypothetical protein